MSRTCYQWAESGTCSYGSACKFSHSLSSVCLPLHSDAPNFSNRSQKPSKAARAPAGIRNKRTNNEKTRRGRPSEGPLDTFFAQYPEFDYRQNASSTGEFYRMCDFFDWDRDDPDRQDAHDDFKTALVQQFNSLYGTEVDSLESWQGLSVALDIVPLPDNVSEAKKVIDPGYLSFFIFCNMSNQPNADGKCF